MRAVRRESRHQAPRDDAVYPVLLGDSDGDPTTGEQDYVVHFDADKLPPVDAFWSITMYDAEGYQVANELDLFAIGDRDPLTYNPDGSLDIYIQPITPGPRPRGQLAPCTNRATGDNHAPLRAKTTSPRRTLVAAARHEDMIAPCSGCV